MKVGVICSAGGSAFFSAYDIARECGFLSAGSVLVVTDRPCGAEDKCDARNIPFKRIEKSDNAKFSATAAEAFTRAASEIVLMFFSRLVTRELFAQFPCFNIHPSLLPAFKGFRPLRQARDHDVRILGATLHIASEEADSGAIVCQVSSPLALGASDEEINRLSFIQKTYLSLCAIDLWSAGIFVASPGAGRVGWRGKLRATPSANPALVSECCIRGFAEFQAALNANALVP